MENFSQTSFIDNNNVPDDEMIEKSTFNHPIMMHPVSMQKELKFYIYIYSVSIFTLDNGPRRHAARFSYQE